MVNKYYTNDYQEAEFNLAVGTIFRIDGKLQEANLYYSSGDLLNYFKSLQIVYTEVSPFLNDNEKKEQDDKEIDLKKEILNSIGNDTRTRTKIFTPIFGLEEKLKSWDRDLRGLMLKYKLYMKMADNRLAASRSG